MNPLISAASVIVAGLAVGLAYWTWGWSSLFLPPSFTDSPIVKIDRHISI